MVMSLMWRCLILVAAALARSNARRSGNPQLKMVVSALQKGDVSFLNDVEAVRYFLDAGWDVNERTRVRNQTILHIAAKHGDPKVVQFLVGRGAHVNIQESDGVTPLMVACMENRPKNVKALLDLSADPTIARKDGLTPLHVATMPSKGNVGNVLLINLLVEHGGADVNAQIPFAAKNDYIIAGNTPLHFAVHNKQKDAIAALTKHGADWDIKNAEGMSAADIGAENGMSRDQFEHLVEARADGVSASFSAVAAAEIA